MFAKHRVLRLLLSGFILIAQQGAQCMAADLGAVGQGDAAPKQSGGTEDDAARKGRIRTLWAKYQRMGVAAFKRDDLEMAQLMLVQAVQEAELLNFDSPDQVYSLDSLALLYERMGKMDESLQAEKKALDIRSRLPGDNRTAKAFSLKVLGDICLAKNDSATAKSYYQQALDIAQALGNPQMKATIMDSLASMASSSNDPVVQKEYAVQMVREDEGKKPDENSASHCEQYARVLWQEGQLSEARKYLLRAFNMRTSLQAADDPTLIAASRNLIRANLILGNVADAEKELGKVLNFDRAHLAPNAPDYLFDMISLGEIKLRHGEAAAARVICEEVQKAQKDAKGQNALDQADTLSLLARVCAAQNQWYEAIGLATQACSLRQGGHLPEALNVYDYETLGRAASHQGQFKEAEARLQQALAIRENQFKDDPADLSKTRDELQALHEQVNKPKDEGHISEHVTSTKTE